MVKLGSLQCTCQLGDFSSVTLSGCWRRKKESTWLWKQMHSLKFIFPFAEGWVQQSGWASSRDSKRWLHLRDTWCGHTVLAHSGLCTTTKRSWDWGQESLIAILALLFDRLCDLGLNYELRDFPCFNYLEFLLYPIKNALLDLLRYRLFSLHKEGKYEWNKWIKVFIICPHFSELLFWLKNHIFPCIC